ncbi:PREDICTED: 39S ribosomal protein L41-A, mitochondrial-like [Acropora digitifera]|uniref:39S ribosomal protein L41-A, mitochondrial-like n=1 Tax=Acropora digitifera TaxID=70779 RepID=UPI00077A0EF7|nr:PREDICTED: 39S ribosomal protein L41-A, mitochondrial-like [Acropora digitifera]
MPLNILRGLFRGASRGVMTGKRGNKNFYKGRGVRNPGYHTRRGAKLLKPYVSYKSPKVEIPPPTAESLLTSIKENIHLIKYRETP